MADLQCMVIAAPKHANWLSDWSECNAPAPGLSLRPSLNGIGEQAADAVLMLIANDSLSWARQTLMNFRRDAAPVVAVTRCLRAGDIRKLLELGARDFVGCECNNDELTLRLWRVKGVSQPNREVAAGAAGPCHPKLARLIGSSPIFLQQIERIPVVAGCDSGVLILGETGTGKELCAQAIHYTSARAANPWVAINCGALPADLVEGELFGHARGAYTGAHQGRTGLIAEAQGGTLFLDEIDSMPLAAQAKILRFLQEKEYRPVGSSRALHADVRVIAASNDDLDSLVRQGRFRRDLYYRINIFSICLPPLRERLDDLRLLARHFVSHYAHELKREVYDVSAAALEQMAAYAWPGNVRELEHVLERAVLLCKGQMIDAGDVDLPEMDSDPSGPGSFQHAKALAVRAFERMYIERMLLICHGNITHAAQACGKNRRAFWQLIRMHGINAERYRA